VIESGVTAFLEVGPGKVIAAIVRRICREAKIFSTDSLIGTNN
jgi:malonyl CoA-acyl carrier protein transacylase